MTQPVRSGLEFQPRSPALPKPALALGLQCPYHGETNPSHQPGKKALGVFRELVWKFGGMQGWKTAAELKSSDIIVCCRVIYLLQLNLVIFQLFQLSKNRLHLDGPGWGGAARNSSLLILGNLVFLPLLLGFQFWPVFFKISSPFQVLLTVVSPLCSSLQPVGSWDGLKARPVLAGCCNVGEMEASSPASTPGISGSAGETTHSPLSLLKWAWLFNSHQGAGFAEDNKLGF